MRHLVVLALLAAPSVARAESKAECVAASERAQALRDEHHLRAARKELLACGKSACPTIVREDCARWLAEVDASTPSIVPGARDPSGADVTDARLFIDGEEAPLDGTAIPIDPGPHTLRFARANDATTVQLVVRQGEKNRIVTATIGAPTLTPTPTPTPTPSPTPPPTPFPIIPVVLGGIGLVALGGALYFRLRADSDASDLRTSCAPGCPESDRDALSTKLVVSNVALGIGIGAIAAGVATFFLTRPTRER